MTTRQDLLGFLKATEKIGQDDVAHAEQRKQIHLDQLKKGLEKHNTIKQELWQHQAKYDRKKTDPARLAQILQTTMDAYHVEDERFTLWASEVLAISTALTCSMNL